MTNEQAIKELRMALHRLKMQGHCDNNRQKAFDKAIGLLEKEKEELESRFDEDLMTIYAKGKNDGFMMGVEETTEKAHNSKGLASEVLEDFYDFANNYTKKMEYYDTKKGTKLSGDGWLSCDLYGLIGDYLETK